MSGHALIPLTGEAIALDAPTPDLADALDRLAEYEREMRAAKDLLREELASRLDRENARKVMDGGFQIEVDAPGQTEWDAEQLERVLTVLVEERKLTEGAARTVLEPVRALKPRKRELAKLLTLPHLSVEDREALAACERPTGRPRRVKVTRA